MYTEIGGITPSLHCDGEPFEPQDWCRSDRSYSKLASASVTGLPACLATLALIDIRLIRVPDRGVGLLVPIGYFCSSENLASQLRRFTCRT